MYIVNDDNQTIDTETGEILDLDAVKTAKEYKLTQDLDKMSQELISLGKEPELKLVKYKNQKHQCVSIKHGYTFGKVFRVTLRDIMKQKLLSKNAKVFIATFEPFIYFPTNSIIINEGNPSIKDLEDMIEFKSTTMKSILKELEKEEIIKRVKLNGQTIIYFNPFLYCSGAYVLDSTYKLFKFSKYNMIPNK